MIEAKEELRFHEQQVAAREEWDTWHQRIMELVLPRRAYISQYDNGPGNQFFDGVYDTTAAEGVASLANMMTAQLTPPGTSWMTWRPPAPFKDDEEIADWYALASERVAELVARSNFQGVQHEVNLDVTGPGTGAIFCERGKRSFFSFRHIELGSFWFIEDGDGQANVFGFEVQMTAAQAMQEYPNGEFGAKFSQALADPQRKHSDKFRIITIIRPREDRNPNAIDAKNKPYASIVLCKEDECVVQEGGYDEFPVAVRRFQKWGGGHQWGVSPTRKAMPAIHQVNFLESMMDELAEVQVNPRILSLAGQVGEIDFRAAGRTLVTARALQLQAPREWLTGGRYDVGKDRTETKREQIKRLFFSSLWGDLSHDSKQRTATEIEEISRRDRMMFLPVASRFDSDMAPMMSRLFSMALNEPGFLPPPPEKLIRETGEIPDPVTAYRSRLFRVMEEEQTAAFDELFLRVSGAAQFEPDVFDDFDTSAALREIARAKGVNEKVIRPREEVDEIRAAKAEAVAKEQALQAAQGAAKAAKDTPPEMREQLTGALTA